ncbi:hypothetical protein U1Q18_000585 [Sarracenia purpurea var. burkii]
MSPGSCGLISHASLVPQISNGLLVLLVAPWSDAAIAGCLGMILEWLGLLYQDGLVEGLGSGLQHGTREGFLVV